MRSRRGRQLDRIERELDRLKFEMEGLRITVADRIPDPVSEERNRWAGKAEAALDLAINATDPETAKVHLKIAQTCQEIGSARDYYR